MSCFGCSKKYGMFTKEYGCPNCGYSYCAKCLKRPMAVPRQGGKVLNVCLICYDKLSKLQATEKVIDCEALPGTIVTKPLLSQQKPESGIAAIAADSLFENDLPPDALGEILAPSMPSTKTETHSNANTSEIDENLDSVISKRLKDLKTVDNLSSDDEIRARLTNLSGMPHNKNYDKKDLLLQTDQRTEQEKINDLLENFLVETDVDQRVSTDRKDAITDIERRLRALRDAPVESTQSTNTNTPSDNEENVEDVIKSIIAKYVAEANLPETNSDLNEELNSSNTGVNTDIKPAETEELPWCIICNEDAIYRCKGCEGDLFCRQCYHECHDDDEEYRQHPKENYTAPPKFKENHF